jgi:hypothetical protein
MSGKRISMGLKPGASRSVDDWVGTPSVEQSQEPPVPIKRLTVDIPEPLHRRLKVKAAQDGVRMVDLVRRWIEDGCADTGG